MQALEIDRLAALCPQAARARGLGAPRVRRHCFKGRAAAFNACSGNGWQVINRGRHESENNPRHRVRSLVHDSSFEAWGGIGKMRAKFISHHRAHPQQIKGAWRCRTWPAAPR